MIHKHLHKLVTVIAITVMAVIMQGCTSSDFSITGDVEGLGTQNLRVLYIANDALVANWLPAVENKFTFKGSSKEPVVVEFYTRRMKVLARVEVKNGENISISGSMPPNGKISIKGDKLTEQWHEWLREHEGEDREKAIEEYVLNNRDSRLAALLLVYDYTTPERFNRAIELLDTLEQDAVPEFATARLKATTDMTFSRQKEAAKDFNFTLYSNSDTTEKYEIGDKPVNLIYVWDQNNSARQNAVKKLRKLQRSHGKSQLRITDIAVQPDTFAWKQAIKPDTADWRRFWAPGGRINPELKEMGAFNIPLYIVADSSGKELYRGVELDSATAVTVRALKRLNKDKR